mmetsp:Transcript_1209/g.3387  ORF Transcript_1209/g.3387 Transcript_1209/m.3387 type:complete len:250 (-) Transcript_1209:141-890(-)
MIRSPQEFSDSLFGAHGGRRERHEVGIVNGRNQHATGNADTFGNIVVIDSFRFLLPIFVSVRNAVRLLQNNKEPRCFGQVGFLHVFRVVHLRYHGLHVGHPTLFHAGLVVDGFLLFHQPSNLSLEVGMGHGHKRPGLFVSPAGCRGGGLNQGLNDVTGYGVVGKEAQAAALLQQRQEPLRPASNWCQGKAFVVVTNVEVLVAVVVVVVLSIIWWGLLPRPKSIHIIIVIFIFRLSEGSIFSPCRCCSCP